MNKTGYEWGLEQGVVIGVLSTLFVIFIGLILKCIFKRCRGKGKKQEKCGGESKMYKTVSVEEDVSDHDDNVGREDERVELNK